MARCDAEPIPYTARNTKLAWWCGVRRAYVLDNYVANTLPLVGWLKQCNVCELVSGHHATYTDHRQRTIHVALCRHCHARFVQQGMLEYVCEDLVRNVRFVQRCMCPGEAEHTEFFPN